jgi:thiol-disulfide isomerase/thioredoxin
MEMNSMKRTGMVLAALAALPLAGSLISAASLAADAPKERVIPKDRVVVMYFHRTQRCPTCLKMGSYTEEAVKTAFSRELKAAKVAFHTIDFQDERNAAYTKGYAVAGPTLIVAKVSGKKVVEYKNLDEMWSLVADKEAFLGYVRASVKEYLEGPQASKSDAKKQEAKKQEATKPEAAKQEANP